MDYESYMGTVAPFAGNFAPRNWMTCNGQTIAITQNQALYALLGTVYGGNGTSTFCLPNLGGRVGIGQNNANYPLGAMAGTEQVTLLSTNLPIHTHSATAEATIVLKQSSAAASSNQATASDTLGQAVASSGRDSVTVNIYGPAPGTLQMPAQAQLGVQLARTGDNLPFSVVQPFLALTPCICVYGIYPSRN